MQITSDFELAQKRLKLRQRRRTALILWSIVFVGMLLGNLVLSAWIICLLPLTISAGVMAVTKLIQLYDDSLNRSLQDDLIAREMEWLFGEDWRQSTGAAEYTFAQDRIRKRRLDRWRYGFSFLFAIPIVLMCIAMLQLLINYRLYEVFLIPVVILLILFARVIHHGRRVFAPEHVLARRERNVGDALRLELERMHPPEKRKRSDPFDDKSKRNVTYTVGDDGELVEIESLPDEEKSKHEGL